ncbi:ArsR family transcriptional regulator [Halobacteriales archaeon QS_8_69_26]|nr:MAG: ArsR family transcriptional regulator [Halobacteriales archaeon QS_8_69_26]
MSHPSPSSTERPERADAESAHAEAPEEGELRTLWLDSDDTGDLISSLSSETARSILVRLHEDPATASEIAESVDTSVQNVRHHLDSLQEAGLVEVTDMRYSSKGREMDVYAPVDQPLVVLVGSEDDGSGFVDSLKRFLGAIGVLAAASLLIQYLVVLQFNAGSAPGIPRVGEGAGAGGLAPLGMPPGLLFFAGGMLVLAMASAWTYWRNRPDATPA